MLKRLWPGTIDLCCNGRFVSTGTTKTPMVLVLIIMNLCIVGLFALPVRYFSLKYRTSVHYVVATILSLLCLTCFYFCTTTDPGVLIRRATKTRGKRPPRKQKFISENRVATSVELRYCDSCDLFQPPRCWHCAVCENCVLQFDHHCPWIGNCVGQRNYHYFFCLILFSTMTLLYTIVLCIVQIVTVTRADENYVTLSNILSAVLLLFTFVLSWSTITLLGFHTYLVIRNLTTYEHIRLVGLGSFAAGTKSKNSNGLGIRNIQAYFVHAVPSYLGHWLDLNAGKNAARSGPFALKADEVYALGTKPVAKRLYVNDVLPQDVPNMSYNSEANGSKKTLPNTLEHDPGNEGSLKAGQQTMLSKN